MPRDSKQCVQSLVTGATPGGDTFELRGNPKARRYQAAAEKRRRPVLIARGMVRIRRDEASGSRRPKWAIRSEAPKPGPEALGPGRRAWGTSTD
jgi:hypothetical protein